MRPLIVLCKCSCRLAALACSQLAIIGLHAARVHMHATCARWLNNSPLTIACCESPMPGRCVHACLARLLMSSLSCIPAFSPHVERCSRSRFNFPRNITAGSILVGHRGLKSKPNLKVGGVACSGAAAAVRRASGTRSGGAGRSAVRQAPSDHPQQVHRGLRAVCPRVPRCVPRATTCSQLWSARAVPCAGWARVRH